MRYVLEENIETVHDKEEFYKFTWWGKKQAKQNAKEQINKTLRPIKSESKNWDKTKNLYIEGDNLEALKILQNSYYNKIKMIYIDPPYNTGKDFVYHDKFQDTKEDYLEKTGQKDEEGKLVKNEKTNGKYHSNWLNMIYPRLIIARKLLTEDGVIFISIDDNELDNLRKICDELFGEQNFITTFIWKSKTGGAGDSSNIAIDCEYVVCYSKNHNKIHVNKKETHPKDFKFKDKYFNEKGYFRVRNLDESGIRYSKSLDFEIKKKGNRLIIGGDEIPIKDYYYFSDIIKDDFLIVPGGDKNHLKKYTWRWSKPKLINGLNKGYLCFKMNSKGNIKLVQKNYEKFDTTREEFIEGHFVPYRNWIDFTNTSRGTNDLKEIFNEYTIFDYPKPVNLIEHFMKIGLCDNDFILDFFSGSATSAHALFELNSVNNLNNNFILVQIPEGTDENSQPYKEGYKTICDIGKERIRRAGDKILEESENKDLDIGFKVFKVDSSNFIPWNVDIESKDIEQAILSTNNNIVDGRSEIDLVYELMLQKGLNLNYNVKEKILDNEYKNKIYLVENGYMIVCLDNNISSSIAKDLLDIKEEEMIDKCHVILRDSALDDDTSLNIYEILNTENIDFKTI